VDVIYASPLYRALETAAPLAALGGAPLLVCNDLVECNGWLPYAGASRAELRRRYPAAQLEPAMPEAGWTYPGPESAAAIATRAAAVRARLAARPETEAVAVIAHGTFNGVLLAAWLGVPPRSAVVFAQDNAGISLLRLAPGRATLVRLNDTAHLCG